MSQFKDDIVCLLVFNVYFYCDLDAHAQKSIALTAQKTTVLPSKLEQYT